MLSEVTRNIAITTWGEPAMQRKSSHVVGATTPPLIEATIGEMLDRAVARWPKTEALVSIEQDIRWTYEEFGRRVDRLAAGLLALGLEPGDRVGVWAPNCAEWTLAQFATARARLIQVNVNPAYRLSELEYTLNKVGVKALISAHSFKTSDYVGMVETLAPEVATSAPGELEAPRLPQLRIVAKIGGERRAGWLEFSDIASDDLVRLREVAATAACRQPINIQFTSGTTGLPKGATLSHRNIVNNAYFVGLSMGLRAGDRLCVPVPLYHCFGMVLSNLACVVHGATMVYPSAGFDPLAVLKAVQAERCTALHGVPTMFIAELQHPEFDSFDLSIAARRHHGGRAVPDRSHAAGLRPHGDARSHHRLRHDRDEPGELSELDRRSHRTPGVDGRSHPAAHGSQGHRPRRTHARARGSG